MEAMSVVPLPWRPPVVGPLEGRLAAWADGVRWPDGGALGAVRWRRASTEPVAAIAARVAEPAAVALTITARDPGLGAGPWTAIAVVPWPVVVGLVAATLGSGAVDELAAPRPPTAIERALVAGAIADALARAEIAADVGLGRPVAPSGACALVHLAVSRPGPAEVVVIVPDLPAPRLRPLASLLATRGGRLPAVPVIVELARAALPAAAGPRLAALVPGDVIVVGRSAPALRVGRGRVAGALDLAAGELTVAASYLRADPVSDPNPQTLADDLSIPLTVVAGEVAVSARALLELAPGAVLPLGRPLGGAVELWAGGRRIARGELVEVEGALGVRVAELLVEAAPAARAVPSVPVPATPPRGH